MNVAPTGQTCVHGESAQWLHSLGTKKCFAFGSESGPPLIGNPSYPPLGESTIGCSMSSGITRYCSTHVRKYIGSSGTLFSALQARTQLPQPMHVSTSITMPHQ